MEQHVACEAITICLVPLPLPLPLTLPLPLSALNLKSNYTQDKETKVHKYSKPIPLNGHPLPALALLRLPLASLF